MENEQILTEKQSLEIITQMINKAKSDYRETGIGALMWGSIVTICSLVTFANYYWNWQPARYVWFLTYIALVPQVIISVRESRKTNYKTYNAAAMAGIWISFGVALILIIWFINTFQVQHVDTLFLIVYGIPTFATGYTRNFKAMIFGGIACWLFAVASMYIAFPYTMLLTAAAALLAWFVPGLMLRRRFLKAKANHV